MEIERKWVAEAAPDLSGVPGRELRQGYVVADDRAETRVRDDDGVRTLTVKGGHGQVREEVELPLEADAFARLWALTDGRWVVKRRYAIALGDGLTAEVDVYAEALAGLVTVEVEFATEEAAAAFAAPAWMGREVTGDRRYANAALAVDGCPS